MAQQTDEIVIRFSVRDDGTPKIERVNGAIKKTGEQTKALVPGLEKARAGVSSFLSENAALIGVLVGVGIALGKALKYHMEYASAVRQQAAISHTTTEEASRYLQVLDDYKISSQNALVATRALTNAGHVPSIETLAQLSDQYLKLNSDQEKNEFILKNLGRGGLQWVDMLNKGSDAIRKQGAAVSENLILDQKKVDMARRLEIAQDQLNDTSIGWATIMSSVIIPVGEAAVSTLVIWANAIEKVTTEHIPLGKAIDEAATEMRAEQDALLELPPAADDASNSLDGLTDSSMDAEEAAKRLSQVYQGLLTSMFAIQGENDSYQQKLDDLAKSSEDLATEKDRLTLAMWKEKEAGELTNDEYERYIQQMAEITEKQDENAASIEQAAADHEKAAKQRVYDLVQERLAADGVIDSGEFEYLQELAVQKGLVSKAAADQAIAESQAADELVASFAKTQDPMNEALATMLQIKSMDGHIVNFGVNFTQSGSPYGAGNGLGQAGGVVGGSGGSGSARRMQRRDSGGAGIAGTPYEIGVPEVFVAPANGQFIPLHGAQNTGLGNTYNVIVNNPRRETAENSVRRVLKEQSYLRARN